MAKNVYIGVSGKARKTKNIYVGVGGKARRVLKGYIGIGGKARLFYVKEWKVTSSTVTDLSQGREDIAATTVGNYALFGGGHYESFHTDHGSNIVDTYNTSLTHSTTTNLIGNRTNLAATTVGNYALFAGGDSDGNEGRAHNTVDVYNSSLTKSTATQLSEEKRFIAATTVGNYALFAGGETNEYESYTWSHNNEDNSADLYYASEKVDAYNSSLTKSTATNLTYTSYDIGATTVGNYALFAGGRYYSIESYEGHYTGDYPKMIRTVDVYNSSLTKSTATDLSYLRCSMAATTVGNYALFAGGRYKFRQSYDPKSTDMVEVYNSSLTKIANIANLTTASLPVATTVNGHAFIYLNSRGETTVDVYNSSLTKLTSANVSVSRFDASATSIGDYALFAGGYYSYYIETVDAFKIS